VNETTIKRGLMDALKKHAPGAVALRHEDLYTAGIPDLSITLNGRTSWWEIKYADPHTRSSKVQKYLCGRLDEEGICRYVIYQRGIPHPQNPRQRQIRMVKPADVDHWKHCGKVISEGVFDHVALVTEIQRIHGVIL
tara:strand:+ start:189 stop:599 length:411 start_codon:yes stop_codon:yes gene_type:complete